MAAFVRTPTIIAGKTPSKNCPKEMPLSTAMTRFCGLPMGVAAEPMLELVARARRNGCGGRLFCLATLRMNSVSTTQQVSLVKSALAMADTMQTRKSRSLLPLLFQESRLPRYLNMSALSRKMLTTMVPKRRPMIGRSMAA
ncbi:Os03g0147550 [Oryza sativa Japonica Group]|uniref:Os03g0147550 protein n=1 Tax=Oryza sativa subsp. japonica TaxID=39947 RepID=A0A0P0VT27_ORYSJ|nr:hypothetical protein EE612_015310 [Oryza sativa]BAS82292.1 Os03g0147550 [Oryza sativa Japonica Group]